MEARYNLRRFPVQPVLVALTVLFALVLGLLGGYAVARIDAGGPVAVAPRVVVPINWQSPDAQERNEQMRQLLSQDTHGH